MIEIKQVDVVITKKVTKVGIYLDEYQISRLVWLASKGAMHNYSSCAIESKVLEGNEIVQLLKKAHTELKNARNRPQGTVSYNNTPVSSGLDTTRWEGLKDEVAERQHAENYGALKAE